MKTVLHPTLAVSKHHSALLAFTAIFVARVQFFLDNA